MLIPKVVYYTWKNNNFTQEIEDNINHNKKLCPNYKFVFYNYLKCNKFIKENFSKQVYNAYMNINPLYGAMKADFWRYCIIYKYGGIYLDIEIKLTTNLDNIIQPHHECILDKPNYLELYRIFYNQPAYEQWLLIYKPKHPYLKKLIKYITMKINNNYLPTLSKVKFNLTNCKQAILKITGPDIYTKIINSYIKKNKTIHHIIPFNSFANYNYLGLGLYKKNNMIHYSMLKEPIYLNIDKKEFIKYIS